MLCFYIYHHQLILNVGRYSILHSKIIPDGLLSTFFVECSLNVYFWHQYRLLVRHVFTFDLTWIQSYRLLVIFPLWCTCTDSSILLQVLRKFIHQMYVMHFSSKATNCWKYEVAYSNKGGPEDFPFSWHDKTLLIPDLIYVSILSVFVNNNRHLLKTSLSSCDACMKFVCKMGHSAHGLSV